jgi:hypothetical protein
MARKRREKDPTRAEVTREVTGNDAPADDADAGSVGSGDPAETADVADDIEEQFHLEGDPSHAEDIAPDRLERESSAPEEEDREYTALPRPEDERRPITADRLPTRDRRAGRR